MPLRADAQLDTSSPWPKWAADNRNTGRGVKSRPSGYVGVRVRWSSRLPLHQNPHYRQETVERGIVLGSDGKVFVPTGAGRLFCFDAVSGNELWRFATDAYDPDDPMKWANAGTPALVDPVQTGIDGRDGPVRQYDVVFGCKAKVYCLIPQTGGVPPLVRWTYTLPDRYHTEASPVVRYDGRIYFPAYATNRPEAPGLLIALNKNGTEAWRLELDAYDGPGDPRMDNVVFTNPAMGADGTIYVGTRGGTHGGLDNQPGYVYALWGFE